MVNAHTTKTTNHDFFVEDNISWLQQMQSRLILENNAGHTWGMSVPGDLLDNVFLRLLLLKTMAETNRIAWKECFSGTLAQNVFTYGILYFHVQVQKSSKGIKQIHIAYVLRMHWTSWELSRNIAPLQVSCFQLQQSEQQ